MSHLNACSQSTYVFNQTNKIQVKFKKIIYSLIIWQIFRNLQWWRTRNPNTVIIRKHDHLNTYTNQETKCKPLFQTEGKSNILFYSEDSNCRNLKQIEQIILYQIKNNFLYWHFPCWHRLRGIWNHESRE